MTTMDFVYLGLIGITALVCYCHGFFAGVKRSRRVYEALLGSADPDPPPHDEPPTEFDAPTRQTDFHNPRLPFRGRELRGDFGEN